MASLDGDGGEGREGKEQATRNMSDRSLSRRSPWWAMSVLVKVTGGKARKLNSGIQRWEMSTRGGGEQSGMFGFLTCLAAISRAGLAGSVCSIIHSRCSLIIR